MLTAFNHLSLLLIYFSFPSINVSFSTFYSQLSFFPTFSPLFPSSCIVSTINIVGIIDIASTVSIVSSIVY